MHACKCKLDPKSFQILIFNLLSTLYNLNLNPNLIDETQERKWNDGDGIECQGRSKWLFMAKIKSKNLPHTWNTNSHEENIRAQRKQRWPRTIHGWPPRTMVPTTNRLWCPLVALPCWFCKIWSSWVECVCYLRLTMIYTRVNHVSCGFFGQFF